MPFTHTAIMILVSLVTIHLSNFLQNASHAEPFKQFNKPHLYKRPEGPPTIFVFHFDFSFVIYLLFLVFDLDVFFYDFGFHFSPSVWFFFFTLYFFILHFQFLFSLF